MKSEWLVPPPRLIRPNAVYLVTRRVEQRRFLLRPDDKLTQLFVYLLALFLPKFGIALHAAVVLSTHYHLVISVPGQNASELMHVFNVLASKAVKVLRRCACGVVWEPGRLGLTELVTEEAVVEKIAYVIVNPVACGAVYEPKDWPGLVTLVEDLGRRVLAGTRPSFFFGGRWPESARVRVTVPDVLMDRYGSEDCVRQLIADEVERQMAEARSEVAAKGWSVIGRVRAANVSPYRRATSYEPFGELNPRIAAGRGQTARRIEKLIELREFREAHRAAKERWRAGDRDVVFPAGTYWMRVHHHAVVAPFE